MSLLVDAALLALGAALLARAARALQLPPLLGMIAAGVLVGALDLGAGFDGPTLRDVSSPARLAILAVVLLRAGLGLARDDLREAGALGLRLGVLPLAGDALLLTLGAWWLLELPVASAAVLGCLVAAISPAIVIPGLLDLLGRGEARHRRVLTALLVGAPLDSMLALVAMGVALDAALLGGGLSAGFVGQLAFTVGAGVAAGVGAGAALGYALRRAPSLGVPLLWAAAGGLIVAGRAAGFSFVLAIIAAGLLVRARAPHAARASDDGLRRVWGVAQYALFGLIGAAVDLGPVARAGLLVVAVVALGQLGRAAACFVATARAGLSGGERLACALAYVPKATIQAAFAALPLDRGVVGGEVILTAAVLAVVLTAPLGVVTLHRGLPRALGGERGGG